MPNRSQELQAIAIAIVGENQPCKPYYLLDRLKREYGASHGEANQTLLVLIRDGRLKRTFFGDLVLPGGGGNQIELVKLAIYLVFMGVIVVFIAWVFYRLFLGS